MKDRQEHKDMQREGTYSSSLHRPTAHIGDSRTGLDWALPVAKESEEQLWDGATAVVRLQEGEVERRNERREGEERRSKQSMTHFTAQEAMRTDDCAETRKREITQMNGTLRKLSNFTGTWASGGWWDTYPAGAAPLAFGKEEGGTLQHRPWGGPVLPARHN